MDQKLIMVIDDEESIREILKQTLEFFGNDVILAENGRQALELLDRQIIPNIILVDIMMPIMNGWEFLEQVKKRAHLSGIPIIVITAFKEDPEKLKHYSVNQLKKPIS